MDPLLRIAKVDAREIFPKNRPFEKFAKLKSLDLVGLSGGKYCASRQRLHKLPEERSYTSH